MRAKQIRDTGLSFFAERARLTKELLGGGGSRSTPRASRS
jgi:hypothetical protein